MSRLLAIDTATEGLALGLDIDGRRHCFDRRVGRGHSEQLRVQLDALLAEAGLLPAQLDAVICGVGPGSFAGLRIGVGFVKGLALALDLPVLPVSSLAALAEGALHGTATGRQALACIDARMGEVYWARYRRTADGGLALQAGPGLCAPETVPVDTVPGAASGDVGSGSGFRLAALVSRVGITDFDADALPGAGDYLTLGRQGWQAGAAISADALAPLYLRQRVALTIAEREAGERL